MMLSEGAAGAAQYEEAYSQNNRSGRGNASGAQNGNGTIQPRKLQNKGGSQQEGYYGGQQQTNEDGNNAGTQELDGGSGTPQRESLPPMTLPSGAIYTG